MVINTTPSENYSIVSDKKLDVNNNEGNIKVYTFR